MKPKRKAVRCGKCDRYICSIEITTECFPLGGLAEIRDIRCGRCKFVNHISIGIADADVRGDAERIEEKLREKLEEERK